MYPKWFLLKAIRRDDDDDDVTSLGGIRTGQPKHESFHQSATTNQHFALLPPPISHSPLPKDHLQTLRGTLHIRTASCPSQDCPPFHLQLLNDKYTVSNLNCAGVRCSMKCGYGVG
ncbi:uncharacterized [Tachysurus ichikawai]